MADEAGAPFVPPPFQIVHGLHISAKYTVEAFQSALDYKPRSDDVFIATYPKSGTTWAQSILALIFRQGRPVQSPFETLNTTPFIDWLGVKSVEGMARPGSIKTHLPFRLVPWSEEAKYIYIARNPKDTCVSYYHHMKNLPHIHEFFGTFDQFFDMFFTGNIDYGDYFDHLMGWFEHRNDPNVLFLTYEEMKADTATAVLKMASFIDDKKFAEPLRQDPEKLNNVLTYSSFKYMKENFNTSMDEMFSMPKEDLLKLDVPDEMKKLFAEIITKQGAPNQAPLPPTNFIRKGTIGDWRNYFSEEQSRKLDLKFAERTKGSEVANFWKNCM